MNVNKPLNILLVGVIIVIILSLGSLASVQSSLVHFLGLDNHIVRTSPRTAGTNLEKSRVNRVIDGDTIVLDDGRTIRYLNVDTPETKKPNTPVQCYGQAASDYNKTVMDGRSVLLKSDVEKTDKYGRDLRIVFLEGKNPDDIGQSINANLVRYGYARQKSYKPNTTYESFFIDIEAKAKNDNRGVWQCPKPFEE
jgi:micrococcal nuclease